MRIVFEDIGLQELYEYGQTQDRRYRKYCKDRKFISMLTLKINIIQSASSYEELKRISPLHYESLKHGYSGLSSFRVGNGYVERVICRENREYIELVLLALDDTHYGNKK